MTAVNAASGNYDLTVHLDLRCRHRRQRPSPARSPTRLTSATNGLFTVTLNFGSARFHRSGALARNWRASTNGSAAADSDADAASGVDSLTVCGFCRHLRQLWAAIGGGYRSQCAERQCHAGRRLKRDDQPPAATRSRSPPPEQAAAASGRSLTTTPTILRVRWVSRTSTPKGALQVASGGVAVTGASSPYTGAGAGIFMESGAYGGALFAFDYTAYLPRPLLLNNPGGNVGIGTVNPLAQLHVYDPANSVADIIETGGGVNAWAKTMFKNLNGRVGHRHVRAASTGTSFTSIASGNSAIELQLLPNGNLGLGVTPIAKLHLFDPASLGEFAGLRRPVALMPGPEWSSPTEMGSGIWAPRAVTTGINYTLRAKGVPTPPSPSSQPAMPSSAGNPSVCSLTIRGGCDLAEPFPMKEEVD